MSISLPLRVVTFNIRVDLQAYRNDLDALKDNERPWNIRLPLIIRQLTEILACDHACEKSPRSSATAPSSTLFCLQEALHHQIVDVVSGLNDVERSKQPGDVSNRAVWTYIGFGREDGAQEGEYSPILFRSDTFSVIHTEPIWLSETPSRPSLGWDADCIRILTCAVLQHKPTRGQLAILNTHLDHKGHEARRRGVELILKTIEQTCKEHQLHEAEDLPFVLTGDLNSTPEQDPYRILLSSQVALDALDATPSHLKSGPEATFTGFEPEHPRGMEIDKCSAVVGDYIDGNEKGRIDYAWFGPRLANENGEKEEAPTSRHWAFAAYATLPNVDTESGIFQSDHCAVAVDVVLAVPKPIELE